ncbi:MAG: hypothetical protein ABF629_08200 [Sporolactobacillus sp.]|uniref:hypothetical protein n=1 Tax=Sporolactobacillus sp. STSJ-5 TaxID=2965076 RepID=UPI002107D649|nr:hypothetical protein [Sporolactobacillus sp. STSJ-5]MCQ2008389.1 hypothetical protein [Sporolactobacillus sp. STSJ-5]
MAVDDLYEEKLRNLRCDFEQNKPQSILDRIRMLPSSRTLIENNGFALLMAVIADQSVKSEIAWNLPNNLSKRIGADHFNPQWMIENNSAVQSAIAQKPALHRFPKKISDYILSLSFVINDHYHSADQLLHHSSDYRTFVAAIKEVSGISDKKANFLFLILSLDFDYPFINKEQSEALFDSHLEKWLTAYFNRKISKTEANRICREVSPDNPALLCPYLWKLHRNEQRRLTNSK